MINFLLDNNLLEDKDSILFETDGVEKIMVYNTKFPNGSNFYSINSSFPTVNDFVRNEVTRAIKLVSIGKDEDSAEPWASSYRTYIIEKYLFDDKILNAIKSGSVEQKNKIKQKLIDIISKYVKRIPDENKYFNSKKQAEDWLYDNIKDITPDQIISKGRKRLDKKNTSTNNFSNNIKKIKLKKSDTITKDGKVYINVLALQKDKDLYNTLKNKLGKDKINMPLGTPKAGSYIEIDSKNIERI